MNSTISKPAQCFLVLLALATGCVLNAAEIKWQHLTSTKGNLPTPGESTQQTGAIVADLDKDRVNDFVLSFRQKPPALQWYRRGANGWTKHKIGDINGDGHLDIFAAEMAKWGRQATLDNPEAKAWIFYGDGKGNFAKTELTTGHGWHEGRIADLDGDGDWDMLNKPYTWEAPRVDVWLNNGTKR